MKDKSYMQAWLSVSWIALVIPLIGVVVTAILNGNNQLSAASTFAFMTLIVSVACCVILFVATWMLKGRAKMLPLAGIPVLLVVAVLAYLTYRISGL